MELTYLDRARQALAKSIDLNEIKSIRDKAEALRNYAGRATQMGRQCAIVKLRAERRLGELLAQSLRPGNPKLQPLQAATVQLGKLGISRCQSSRFQAAAGLPEADFEKYLATREPTTAGILKLVRERRRETGGPRSGGHILTCPAASLWQKLADDSVDLMLTDPPYSEVGLYGDLAELAAAKLKPGRLCLAYCGQTYLPDVLEAMGRHLQYHWVFSIRFGGPHRPIYPKQIQNTWQAVVSFSKAKPAAGWVVDLLESGGRSKELHDHEKTLTDIEYLIDKLTDPGALVVDPFCGSGAVPFACKRLGRRWLACERNGDTARTARRRVA